MVWGRWIFLSNHRRLGLGELRQSSCWVALQSTDTRTLKRPIHSENSHNGPTSWNTGAPRSIFHHQIHLFQGVTSCYKMRHHRARTETRKLTHIENNTMHSKLLSFDFSLAHWTVRGWCVVARIYCRKDDGKEKTRCKKQVRGCFMNFLGFILKKIRDVVHKTENFWFS